jgi:hypothetical protein
MGAIWFAVILNAAFLFSGDPFASPARVRVLLFVRTDCPITDRYAPELRRIADEFSGRPLEFWLVYPDPSETRDAIDEQRSEYKLPGEPLLDPHHELVKRAHASVAPEAAVFDSAGRLRYHGRIDDLWVAPGKARSAAQTHDLEDAISAVLAGKAPRLAETHAVGCSLADVQ